jgi:hypothetical protein
MAARPRSKPQKQGINARESIPQKKKHRETSHAKFPSSGPRPRDGDSVTNALANAHPLLAARVAIVLAVLVVFSPVVGHDFGGWDDGMNLVENSDFNPPTLDRVLRYWRAPAFDLYAPLTFSVWGVVARVAYDPTATMAPHLRAMPFHLLNLALHVLSALAVFELLRALFESYRASMIGALIFALHPLMVEPVAWGSGM